MAGAASGEEENYWPGYVDALTTMLMVLTFVMMVLGIVVFTLSQTVSKNVVAAVAEAVDIDTSSLDGRTPETLRQAVISALKEKLAHPGASQPGPGVASPSDAANREATAKGPGESTTISAAAIATAAAVAAVAPTVDSAPAAGSQAALSGPMDVAAPPPAAQAAKAPSLPTFASGALSLPPSPSTLQGDPPSPAPATDTRVASLPQPDDAGLQGAGRDTIIQSLTAPADPARNRPASLADAGDGLKIVFRNGAVQLDQPGTKALDAYARQFEAGSFVVRASAFVASTGATDARRRAYYRAMLVRERIIQTGLPAGKISVEVRDDADAASQDLVLVIGRTKGVK